MGSDKHSKPKDGTTTEVKAQALVPTAIDLNLGANKQQYEAEQREGRQLKAVMLLHAEHQKKVIEDERPKLEKAEIARRKTRERLEKMGKAAVRKLKVSEEFADLRKALQALNMGSISYGISYKELDLDSKEIEFERELKHTDSYRSITGEDTMPFTEKMVEELKKYDEAKEEYDRSHNAIVEAETARRDYANRLAEAQGLLALKNMDEDEQQQVQDIYEHMSGGLTASKLLGPKRDR